MAPSPSRQSDPSLVGFSATVQEKYKNDRKGVYFHSTTRELVTILTGLQCKTCKQGFNRVNLPYIAGCGHYMHKRCVEGDNGVAIVCSDCKSNNSIRTSKRFILDEVLAVFFKAIEKYGNKCDTCKELHPRENCIRRIQKGHNHAKWFCLWCCPEKTSNYTYSTDQNAPECVLGTGDERLSSIYKPYSRMNIDQESRRDYLTASFVQCCACAEFLNYNGKNKLLPCGHTMHDKEDCKEKTFVCNFCFVPYTEEEYEQYARTSHSLEYLGNSNVSREAVAYPSHCYQCKEYHPFNNLTSGTAYEEPECLWCEIKTVIARQPTGV